MEQHGATTPFQTHPVFPDRLAEEAERQRAEAEKIPHGHERDLLLRKGRQTERQPLTSMSG
jgi:creatinine amidohydrolase/Fe(II)-dependent formamide hydrolase-like protein